MVFRYSPGETKKKHEESQFILKPAITCGTLKNTKFPWNHCLGRNPVVSHICLVVSSNVEMGEWVTLICGE
jgi:hypothetical protein